MVKTHVLCLMLMCCWDFAVAQQAGLSPAVGAGASQSAEDASQASSGSAEAMVRQVYDMDPWVAGCGSARESDDAAPLDVDAEFRALYGSLGVPWPEGSSIHFAPSFLKIVVTNTRENLTIFERVRSQLSFGPAYVSIEVRLVAFELARVAELGLAGINKESLTALWTNGHGELLAVPSVMTMDGDVATTKGVTECIYPTAFSIRTPERNGTNTVVASAIVEPSEFETREVGAILSAAPDVVHDEGTIRIVISAECVEEPEWDEFGGPFVDLNGTEQQAHMPQPRFHSCSINTSVSVTNGQTILISGGMPMRDAKRVVYAFLTASLVETNSQRVVTVGGLGTAVPGASESSAAGL